MTTTDVLFKKGTFGDRHRKTRWNREKTAPTGPGQRPGTSGLQIAKINFYCLSLIRGALLRQPQDIDKDRLVLIPPWRKFSEVWVLLLPRYRQALFYCASQMLRFLQTEGKTFHQQKDYDSLHCHICFIAVVWNPTCNIPKVCLYDTNFFRH